MRDRVQPNRCQFEALETRRLLADVMSATVDAGKPLQTIEAIGGAIQAPSQTAEQRVSSYYDLLANDLGASAVRAALWQTYEPVNDNNDPNVIDWSKFNDAAIANTMEIFTQMKARGVTTFLLTIWTPPGWMKTTGAAQHGGGVREEYREEFAEYCSAAIQRAKTKWGIDITHLSLANEPWLVEPYGSATHTPVQLAQLLKAVDARLARDGLATKLIVPEEVSRLQRAYRYLEALEADPAAMNAVDIWGQHYLPPGDMSTLSSRLQTHNKPLWVTEMGQGTTDFAGAIALARGVDSVFTQGQATAYFNWLFSGTASTTTFETLMGGPNPNKKFYALKQFAHWVRPGAKLLTSTYSGDQVRVTSFKHPSTGALTIVLSNIRETDVDLTVNLKGTTIPGSFEQYRTTANENSVKLSNIAGGASMLVHLPAGSIVTLYSGPALNATSSIAAPPKISTPFPSDAWNTNDLREAAMRGELATVQSLIASGADVNASYATGWTALFTAAASPYNDAQKILTELINAGINKLKTDTQGHNALHIAAMNPNVRWGTSGAMPIDRLKVLLAAGLGVNSTDGYGRTALHYAAMYPKIPGDLQQLTFDTGMVEALLDAGANPNAVDSFGKKPVDYAIAEGFTPAIAMLQSGPVTGGIGATVYHDTDKDGQRDSGEAGVSGATVWVDLDDDTVKDAGEPSAVTNSSGAATFNGLTPGSYRVRTVVLSGYDLSQQPLALVSVSGGATASAVFGFAPTTITPPPPPPPPVTGTATIDSYVYNDLNKNGSRQSGENGVAGRVVYVDVNNNSVRESTEPSATTNSSGRFVIKNLGAGTWNLRQVLPAGWIQTKPTNNAAHVVTLTAGQYKRSLDFLTTTGTTPPPPPPPPPDPDPDPDPDPETPPSAGTSGVSGTIVNDLNKNGSWTSGESGIAGRTVWLDLDNDAVFDAGERSVLTDSIGKYTFTNLAAGSYMIREVVPTGWLQIKPSPQYGMSVTLADAQVKKNYNFYVAAV